MMFWVSYHFSVVAPGRPCHGLRIQTPGRTSCAKSLSPETTTTFTSFFTASRAMVPMTSSAS